MKIKFGWEKVTFWSDHNFNERLETKLSPYTVQKMKFFIMDFFSKCDQIRSFLRIWSHLLKKSLMENFNFCAVFCLWYGIGNIRRYCWGGFQHSWIFLEELGSEKYRNSGVPWIRFATICRSDFAASLQDWFGNIFNKFNRGIFSPLWVII